MWHSKKARGQPKEATTVSTRPLMFSNSTSDDNIDPITPPTSSFTGNNGFSYAPLDGFTSPVDIDPTALPPYQEVPSELTKPQQTSVDIALRVQISTNTV